MMQNVEQNLKSLGIELPTAPSPAANYVPFVKVGQFLYVSGQISQEFSAIFHQIDTMIYIQSSKRSQRKIIMIIFLKN